MRALRVALLAVALATGACAPPSGRPVPAPSTLSPPATTTTAAAATTLARRADPGPPLLRVGDAGPLVGAVRYALACNGYARPAGGDLYDAELAGLVEAAQADLGWEVDGEPGLEFLAELSARCPADQRLAFPSGGTVTVVGIAGPGATTDYIVSARAGQSLAVSVEPAGVAVGVGPAASPVAVPEGAERWSGRLPASGDYRIAVAAGEPTVFSLRVRLPEERQATSGTVTFGEERYGVDYVCAAGGTEAEVHWAGFGGGVGRVRVQRASGLLTGLAVDVAAGTYLGDLTRSTVSRTGDLLAGDGDVALTAADRRDVLFAFDVSGAGTCPQLRGDGLGSVAFGATAADAITALAPLLGPPTNDSGWVDPEPLDCVGDAVRFVEFAKGLTLTFTDASSPYGGVGQRHFSFWTSVQPAVVADPSGVAPGDRVGRLTGVSEPQFEESAGTWVATRAGGAADGGITYALSGADAGDEVQAMFAGATPCGGSADT